MAMRTQLRVGLVSEAVMEGPCSSWRGSVGGWRWGAFLHYSEREDNPEVHLLVPADVEALDHRNRHQENDEVKDHIGTTDDRGQ